MHKLLMWIGIMSVVLVFTVFAQSTAQTITPTPNYDLTATRIIEMATGTAKAASTPAPSNGIDQTLTVAHATRTSIALTRDPSLAISPTPNDIQLTATRIVAEVIQTRFAATSATIDPSLLPIELTATAIVIRATDSYLAVTPDPVLVITPLPTPASGSCRPFFTTNNQDELISEMLAAFADAGLPVWYGYIHTTGVDVPTGCEVPFYPLSTQLSIGFTVKDLWGDNTLADLTTAFLSVFIQFPPTEAYGPESTQLIIVFRHEDNFDNQRYIDTGYANALAAYEEGLRGEALLEALGGILPA